MSRFCCGCGAVCRAWERLLDLEAASDWMAGGGGCCGSGWGIKSARAGEEVERTKAAVARDGSNFLGFWSSDMIMDLAMVGGTAMGLE